MPNMIYYTPVGFGVLATQNKTFRDLEMFWHLQSCSAITLINKSFNEALNDNYFDDQLIGLLIGPGN